MNSSVRITAALAMIALVAPPFPSIASTKPKAGATITVDKAEVSGGKLVISGRTAKAGRTVAIAGTSYKTKAKANRRFDFRLTWLPPNCRVTLEVGKKSVPAVIANCAPKGAAGKPGLVAKGEWSPTVSYAAGSVVGLAGSSHVALKAAAKGVQPGTAAAAGIWSTLAAKGDDSADGTPAALDPGGRLAQSATVFGHFYYLPESVVPAFMENTTWTSTAKAGSRAFVTVSTSAAATESASVEFPYNFFATACMRNTATGNLTFAPSFHKTQLFGGGEANPASSVVRSGLLTIPDDGEYDFGLCGYANSQVHVKWGTVTVLVFE